MRMGKLFTPIWRTLGWNCWALENPQNEADPRRHRVGATVDGLASSGEVLPGFGPEDCFGRWAPDFAGIRFLDEHEKIMEPSVFVSGIVGINEPYSDRLIEERRL